MWWIAIPIAVLAAVAFALLLPVKLRVKMGDGFSAEWRVLFYRKMLYPAPPEKKKKKKAKAGTEKKKAPEKKREVTAESAVKMIKSVAEMIGTLVKKLRRRVRIKLIKLFVTVGTDEAAKTAILYGTICNACDELLEIMRRTTKFHARDGAVSVTADFTKGSTDVDVEFDLSLTVIGAISVLLPTLNKYLENK